MSVFDCIDTVPWSRLHHAYGPATDVPDLLKALMWPDDASSELRARAKANGRDLFQHVTLELGGNVYHQGTVWQVTAKTVPFFFEILRNGPNNSACHKFLIRYLHDLAMGYPDDVFPDLPHPDDEFAETEGLKDVEEAPTYNTDEDDFRFLIWWRDSYVAVERNLEFILPCVRDDSEAVAGEAIALLASFPRQTEISSPLLRSIAKTETRRGALSALSLSVLSDPETPEIAGAHLRSGDRISSVLGACSLAICGKENVTPQVASLLSAPLGELAEHPVAHAHSLGDLVERCRILAEGTA